MFERLRENKKRKKTQQRLGEYPSNDMLNNAIKFALDENTDGCIKEILWAIRKADGEIFDYLKPRLAEKGFLFRDEQ